MYEDMDLEDEEEKTVVHRKAKKVEKRANAKSLPRQDKDDEDAFGRGFE